MIFGPKRRRVKHYQIDVYAVDEASKVVSGAVFRATGIRLTAVQRIPDETIFYLLSRLSYWGEGKLWHEAGRAGADAGILPGPDREMVFTVDGEALQFTLAEVILAEQMLPKLVEYVRAHPP